MATKQLPWKLRQVERVEEVKIMGPQWDQSCGNKRRYESEAVAKAAAYRVLCAHGEILTAYRCKFGTGHWHLGHPMGTKGK